MGKSSKKTNVEVVPAVPEVIAKPVKKGKRDAEVVLEKEVSAKRQKKDSEKVVPKEDIKKLKKALKDVPAITKPEISSSEDDSSSDSEEEVKVLPTKRNKLAKAPKKESSSSEESSSDDEPAKTVPTSDKNVSVAAKNGSAAAVTKKEKESSSSESDSDEDEKPAKAAPQSKKTATLKNATPAATKKDESSDSSDSDSGSDDSDEEDAPKAAKVVPAAKKQATIVTNTKKKDESSDSDTDDDDDEDAPKKAPAAKKQATTVANLKKSNDSSETDSDETGDDSDESDDEPQPKKSKVTDSVPSSKTKPVAKAVKKESSSSDEDEDSDESSDDEPSKQQQAKTSTQAPKKSGSSDSSEESSDEESEDEKPVKTPKKDLDVKMKDASVVSAEKLTATKSEKKTNQTPGSRTLFVGNLSFDVGQDDVAEFFKETGEVVEVRLSAGEDGSFKGFGHVEFATVEAAKKALELNGQELFGRAVRLDVARERGSFTPQSRNDSYQKGSKGQSQTIFVKGFDRSLVEDQIRSSLEEHFGSCGEITRVSIPKDYETGASKGIAYIDFTNQDGFNKAFELNGSDLGGYTLTVDEARPKADNRNGGSSGGGDGGRSGGRFGGRGGGGRGGRGDRGRGGRDFGGRGRGRGRAPFKQSAGTASTGKKITFGDD